MKFNSVLLVAFIVMGSVMTFYSCKKGEKCGETNKSISGGHESHNFGMDCMNCHKSGGEGKGCFSVAGSVSKMNTTSPVISGFVKLFTQPNGGGILKYTIPIDSKGNFYSTDNIEYSGLYPVIVGSSGSQFSMSSPISTGACNTCHTGSNKLIAN